MSKLLPPPLFSVVFILAFIANMMMAPAPFINPDVAWHVAAGDWIRKYGIPASDPWSFTAGGGPWYNISWLWDVVLSWLVQHCGILSAYVTGAVFAAAVPAYLGVVLQRRGGISDQYILITMLLVWFVMGSYIFPQSWMMTLLLAIFFHHRLHRSREETDYHVLLPLPIAMILWANTHGGFIVGLSLIAVYAIEAQQTRQYAWFKQLCICFALCVLASFINPYHVFIIDGVLRTMHSVIASYLSDWHPLTVGNDMNLTLILLMFLVCSNIRDDRISIADKILAFGWLMYALHTRRNFMIFAVVGAPYLAWALQEFARYAQGAKYKAFQTLVQDSPQKRLQFAIAAMVAFVACSTPVFSKQFIGLEKLNNDPYRVRVAMEALEPYSGKVKFINSYNLGGYLVYFGGNKWPVFVDGRAGTAYSEELLQDYITFATLMPGYEKIPEKYQARGVIALRNDAIVGSLKAPGSGWQQVYDKGAIVAFVRVR